MEAAIARAVNDLSQAAEEERGALMMDTVHESSSDSESIVRSIESLKEVIVEWKEREAASSAAILSTLQQIHLSMEQAARRRAFELAFRKPYNWGNTNYRVYNRRSSTCKSMGDLIGKVLHKFRAGEGHCIHYYILVTNSDEGRLYKGELPNEDFRQSFMKHMYICLGRGVEEATNENGELCVYFKI